MKKRNPNALTWRETHPTNYTGSLRNIEILSNLLLLAKKPDKSVEEKDNG